MVPVTHQVKTKTGYLSLTLKEGGEREIFVYQGTNAVIRPNTIIVTEAPHIAVLRPNLSDTRPEQKEPRAKPGK